MKRYLIGLTLLFALMNTGCDLCYFCEEESDSIYVKAKILKATASSNDGSGYTDDWEWNGNTATIYKDGGSGRIKYQEISYNAYGFSTESKLFNNNGSVISHTKWNMKDKWKTISQSDEITGVLSSYTWDGNIQKIYRNSDGSLMYENEYDDYTRLIKQVYYSSNGTILREDTQVWDENYRYRGLYRTSSINTGNYRYKCTWDGNSSVFTQYSRDGSISWTSTSTVNKYDQFLTRTYSTGTVYTREFGATFKSYK